MTEGPLGAPRPFANPSYVVTLRFKDKVPINSVTKEEIEKRFKKESKVELSPTTIGAMINVVVPDSTVPYGIDTIKVQFNGKSVSKGDIDKLSEIAIRVFDAADPDSRTNKLEWWSVNA